jgi:MFS family permease
MGRVMSVIGVPMLLGPILGNVIGGAIVDQVSWRRSSDVAASPLRPR